LSSWWLKLHHVGAKLEVIGLSCLILLCLLDLSLLLGELLELLLVLGVGLHLGLVLFSVLLDELLLLAVLLAHVLQLDRHGGGIDPLGTFHEHGEVVAGEGVDLIVEAGVAQGLHQLDDDSSRFQSQKLRLDGLIRFLQHSELLISWILENILNELVKNVEASNDLGFIIVLENVV